MDQSWDETTPTDTDLISNGDDEIRNLKVAIRERMDVEHVFTTGNEANVGEHASGFITEAKGYIAALAVTNANLKTPVHGNGVFSAASVVGVEGEDTLLQSATIISKGGQLLIEAGGFASINSNALFKLYRETTLLASINFPDPTSYIGPIVLKYFETPAEGTYNYYFKVYQSGLSTVIDVSNRSLSVVEVFA